MVLARHLLIIGLMGFMALACGGEEGLVQTKETTTWTDDHDDEAGGGTDESNARLDYPHASPEHPGDVTLLPSQDEPPREPDEECEEGDGCEPLGPPYPIVLAHGFFGFEHFAGVDFATYFYEVREHLLEAGEPLVFTPAVDPFNDSTTRGHRLIEHVEAILEATGHSKVNIIGHSQGGLDARVVAYERPELVASVTTFATPHKGTPIADIALRLMSHSRTQEVIDALVRLAGIPLWDEAGEETSLVASLHQLSTDGAAEFNAYYVDQPEVAYYSLTGRSGMHYGWLQCTVDDAPELVTRYSLALDPVDPLLLVTQQVLAGPFNLRPNDGLVRVQDAKWGLFLGCVPADHLDQIGHLFGALPGLFNPWRHRTFYEDLIQWLRERGH